VAARPIIDGQARRKKVEEPDVGGYAGNGGHSPDAVGGCGDTTTATVERQASRWVPAVVAG